MRILALCLLACQLCPQRMSALACPAGYLLHEPIVYLHSAESRGECVAIETATVDRGTVSPGFVFEIESSGPIAGRPILYGYVIDAAGRVTRYDHTGVAGARSSVETGQGCGEEFCRRELEEKYRLRNKVIGQVPFDDLQRQVPVILPASWGRLQPKLASAGARMSPLLFPRAMSGFAVPPCLVEHGTENPSSETG